MAQDDDPRHGDEGDYPPPLSHEPPPPAGFDSHEEGEEELSAWQDPDEVIPGRPSYRPRHRADRREPAPHAAPPADDDGAGTEAGPGADAGEDADAGGDTGEERVVRRPPYGGRWDKLVASRDEDEVAPAEEEVPPVARPEIVEEASTVPEGEPGPNERSGLWRRPIQERPALPGPGERRDDETPVTGTLVRQPVSRPAEEPEPRRSPAALLVVLALLLVGGGAAFAVYAWLSPAETETAAPELDAGESLVGDKAFSAAANAKGDGVYQRLEDVAAAGSTMVAVGSDLTSTPPRPLFVVSANGGRSWTLGEVSGGGGGAVTPVRHVAGDDAGWLAVNIRRGSTNRMWTSEDGRKWTAVDPGGLAAFGIGDRVTGLARTKSGFVAVGDELKGRVRYPVTWTSKDGAAWRRRPAGSTPATLRTTAAKGDVVVAMGESGSGEPLVLRSADGGATWRAVSDRTLAKARVADAVAAGGKGFVAAVRAGGPAVQGYCSANGEKWSKCGRIGSIDNHGRLADLSGTKAGLSAVVQTSWDRYSVYTSSGGRKWTGKKIGKVPNAGMRGVASGTGGALAVVGDGQAEGVDNQPFLWTPRTGRIPSEKVKGLRKEQRRTGSLAAAGGRLVTVGSARADAAVWTTTDGGTWTHGRQRGEAFGGPGRQELHDVAYGKGGWLAAGAVQDVAGTRPMVVTSRDGLTWQRLPALDGVALAAGEDRLDVSVAAGPAGWVIAGERQGAAPGLWHAPGGRLPGSRGFAEARLPRPPKGGVRLRDVTATQSGFAAVGGTGAGTSESGIVLTSEDGRAWTEAGTVPEPPAGGKGSGLRQVVAYKERLVALGTSRRGGAWVPFAAVSDDGGESWESGWLAGRDAAEVKDVMVVERGLIAVGTTGPFESSDSVVWLSGDGLGWRRQLLEGEGLSGAGAQWLQGAAKLDGRVIAVGRSVTITEDRLTIWRTALK